MFTIIVFLLLGAIVNVAVAWGSARWVDGLADFHKFTEAVTSHGDNAWRLYSGEGMTVSRNYCTPWRYVPPSPPRPDASVEMVNKWVLEREAWEAGRLREPDLSIPMADAPYWSRARSPCTDSPDRIDHYEDARGWPLRSMMSTSILTFDPKTVGQAKSVQLVGGAEMDGVVDRFGAPRYWPLQPIWPGFAINSLVYAAILWLLFATPFALRRRRRIKRSLCPKCAYPFGAGEICTECGTEYPFPSRCSRVQEKERTRAVSAGR